MNNYDEMLLAKKIDQEIDYNTGLIKINQV